MKEAANLGQTLPETRQQEIAAEDSRVAAATKGGATVNGMASANQSHSHEGVTESLGEPANPPPHITIDESMEARVEEVEKQERRKRRRDKWEREQEEKRRWELLRRMVDITADVELLLREVGGDCGM